MLDGGLIILLQVSGVPPTWGEVNALPRNCFLQFLIFWRLKSYVISASKTKVVPAGKASVLCFLKVIEISVY